MRREEIEPGGETTLQWKWLLAQDAKRRQQPSSGRRHPNGTYTHDVAANERPIHDQITTKPDHRRERPETDERRTKTSAGRARIVSMDDPTKTTAITEPLQSFS
jgi:hypothetical protein